MQSLGEKKAANNKLSIAKVLEERPVDHQDQVQH